MLVLRDGSIRGTVGGGALEAGIIKASESVIEGRADKKIDMVLDGKDAVASGMICGGSASVLIEYIDVSTENIELFIKRREEADAESETVYIFGAGHCGMALAPVLRVVGFRVVVIDDRAEFANAKRFPDADEIYAPEKIDADFFDTLKINKNGYIVIVTRGHVHDEVALRGALRTDAGYVGMIGSRKKRESIYERLLSDGYTQADIDRTYSPIGMPIGADTPEEIAISIAAQIIKVRAEGK